MRPDFLRVPLNSEQVLGGAPPGERTCPMGERQTPRKSEYGRRVKSEKLELFPTKCLCVGLSTSAVTYRPANVEKPPVQIYKCDYSPLSVAGKRE